MRDGLAHRLVSKNAYVACADPRHRHDSVIFAICHGCDRIDEMHEAGIAEQLMREVSKHGFAAGETTIESKASARPVLVAGAPCDSCLRGGIRTCHVG